MYPYPAPAVPFDRTKVPPGAQLCDHCVAKCCHYVALPIATPKSKTDFDQYRWFMLHKGVALFIDKREWHLLVFTTCEHLQSDHRCGIYETRPQICRDYQTDDCEFDDSWVYDGLFERAPQLEEYYDAVRTRTKGESIRSPRPVRSLALPVVSE